MDIEEFFILTIPYIVFSLLACVMVGTIYYIIFPINLYLLICIMNFNSDDICFYFDNRKSFKENHQLELRLVGLSQQLYMGFDNFSELYGKSFRDVSGQTYLDKKSGLWMIPMSKYRCKEIMKLKMKNESVIDLVKKEHGDVIETIHSADYINERYLK